MWAKGFFSPSVSVWPGELQWRIFAVCFNWFPASFTSFTADEDMVYLIVDEFLPLNDV